MTNDPALSPEAFFAEFPDAPESLRSLLSTVQLVSQSTHSTSLTGSSHDSTVPDKYRLDAFQLTHYQIHRVLGRGGMGIVFLATEKSLNRLVALKALQTGLTPDPIARQRFQLEARVAASLQHPHIVPVFNIGSEAGIDYFAMQYIEGRSLAKCLRDHPTTEPNATTSSAPIKAVPIHPASEADLLSKTMPSPTNELTTTQWQPFDSPVVRTQSNESGQSQPTHRIFPDREAARIGWEIAQALAAAHRSGIIHRDVKPSNILLDRTGKAYLSDFGLAHVEQDVQLTTPGLVIGSLSYMAPEQLTPQQANVDARADVYSLGATLY